MQNIACQAGMPDELNNNHFAAMGHLVLLGALWWILL